MGDDAAINREELAIEPGWRTDPTGRARWFDGVEWTNQYLDDPTGEQIPSTPPQWRSAAARGFFSTVAAVVVGTGIVAAALFAIWQYNQPDVEALSKQVAKSMNDHLANDDNLSGVEISNVTVVRASGNIYEGQATARAMGKTELVMVHITWDGETLLWQTDPGAFLFAAR